MYVAHSVAQSQKRLRCTLRLVRSFSLYSHDFALCSYIIKNPQNYRSTLSETLRVRCPPTRPQPSRPRSHPQPEPGATYSMAESVASACSRSHLHCGSLRLWRLQAPRRYLPNRRSHRPWAGAHAVVAKAVWAKVLARHQCDRTDHPRPSREAMIVPRACQISARRCRTARARTRPPKEKEGAEEPEPSERPTRPCGGRAGTS